MSRDPDAIAALDWIALQRGASEFGLSLQSGQVDALRDYAKLLGEWNRKFNLTAIVDPQEILIKHFLDSLSCASALDFPAAESLLDVGTGAGFPGLVLKIAFPHLHLTLLDTVSKRLSFLIRVTAALGLANVRIYHARAEDAAAIHPVGPVALIGGCGLAEGERNSKTKETSPVRLRQSFDVVTARAVAPLAVLAEWTLPFSRPGGCVLAMKGPDLEEELADARDAIRLSGGGNPSVRRFTLPGTDIGRSLVLIPKVRSTPSTLPRPPGSARKSPLGSSPRKLTKGSESARRQSGLAVGCTKQQKKQESQ